MKDYLHQIKSAAKEYTVKVYPNGDKVWYLNGRLHREDGPAVDYANGCKAWYLNGRLHREDGPAMVDADGCKAWWLNGRPLTKKQWGKQLNPVKEMLVAEIEKILGHKVKVVDKVKQPKIGWQEELRSAFVNNADIADAVISVISGNCPPPAKEVVDFLNGLQK